MSGAVAKRANTTSKALGGKASFLTATLAAANLKLYMADGGFQIVREYMVTEDRVRYYSVERSDWEEVPVSLVDLKKTEAEAQTRKEALEKQTKEVLEEEAAMKQERSEIRSIPMDPGAYMLENGKLRIFKLADWAMRNPKTKTLLKLVTPVPTASISYMEIPGETSPNILTAAPGSVSGPFNTVVNNDSNPFWSHSKYYSVGNTFSYRLACW